MSEHDEQRPMTRRERRLRDLAETGALDLSDAANVDAEASPVAAATGETIPDEIEISPLNPDGTPRSRREMRQLRDAAVADLEARQGAADVQEEETAPAGAVTVPSEEADVDSSNAPDVLGAADASDEHVHSGEPEIEPGTNTEILAGLVDAAKAVSDDEVAAEAPDFDTLMAPPTEPFSVEELREAGRAQGAGEGGVEELGLVEPEPEPEPELDTAVIDESIETTPASEESDADSSGDAEPTDGESASDEAVGEVTSEEPAKSKRRFPWKRGKAEGAGAAADAVGAEAEAAEVAPGTEQVESEAPIVPMPKAAVESAVSEAEPTPAAGSPAPAEEAEDGRDAETADEPAPGPRRAGGAKPEPDKYSFPDIQPPEEWRSVFDDPTSRTAPGQGAVAGSDFDDLISRAVAQEGATGANTSALILPSMPEDTGGLTGPLGATGELYITGSIDLPKSLGETGGHSAMHDSVKIEPLTMPEAGESSEAEMHGPTPVSAKHAVSARMPSGMPVVAKPTKERSKLPLILTLSGGGLLAAIIAFSIWGATNGMFSG